MNEIFHIVFLWLQGLSFITGLSYKEINIIVYYFLVPLSWLILFELKDKKFRLSFYFLSLVAILTGIFVIFNKFSVYCNWLFFRSVDFLNAFPFVNDPGNNYIVSSVIFCVVIPIAIYIPLIKKNWLFFRKNWLYVLITLVGFNLFVVFGIYKF